MSAKLQGFSSCLIIAQGYCILILEVRILIGLKSLSPCKGSGGKLFPCLSSFHSCADGSFCCLQSQNCDVFSQLFLRPIPSSLSAHFSVLFLFLKPIKSNLWWSNTLGCGDSPGDWVVYQWSHPLRKRTLFLQAGDRRNAGMVVHACNLSIQEVEVGGLPWVQTTLGIVNSKPASQQVEIMLKEKKKETKREKEGLGRGKRIS